MAYSNIIFQLALSQEKNLKGIMVVAGREVHEVEIMWIQVTVLHLAILQISIVRKQSLIDFKIQLI